MVRIVNHRMIKNPLLTGSHPVSYLGNWVCGLTSYLLAVGFLYTMEKNKKIGLKLMIVDVAFHAFDYVILFLWWKFINWIFDNEIIILILMLASGFQLMSQFWKFTSNFSQHWKMYRGAKIEQ